MGGTVYAINVVLTNGKSGYLKFYGDGTWDWYIVDDVNDATMYRSKDECVQDFYKYVKNAYVKNPVSSNYTSPSVDVNRCTIAECYNPWL